MTFRSLGWGRFFCLINRVLQRFCLNPYYLPVKVGKLEKKELPWPEHQRTGLTHWGPRKIVSFVEQS